MAKKLIVGNWKLHPRSFEEASILVKNLSKKIPGNAMVVVCPPAVFLSGLSALKRSKLLLGVQTVFHEEEGAFTGEFSPKMARSAGADYAIVGHSERRAIGETNEIVSKKLVAAMKGGLTSILCVGEKERDVHGHYLSYLKAQIDESIAGVTKALAGRLVVAYEPIWAIGSRSNGAMEARDLHETSLFIKKVLHGHFGKKAFSIPLIYGGSVDPVNAHSLVKEGNVEGLLVGRESLKTDHFLRIISAVSSGK